MQPSVCAHTDEQPFEMKGDITLNLSIGSSLHGFTVETEESLTEIDGKAYTLKHNHSGARLLYLANDDNNKAFSIAFKTPPQNNTGVFHILEHSVLCGSARFPVKEPFVNLIKSSMQTFLNAMTFPDKTMYPVASTNEQDLLNLMDVYMDAVLHPAIYNKRAIFEQEGWHYEIDEETEDLTYNGVVYNEMKGALSDPHSVLYNMLAEALFPDTSYQFESGGDPRFIPSLTYEDFLNSHERHYQLSNSYITLYGNIEVERELAFLDERYLGKNACTAKLAPPPNALSMQSPHVSLDNMFTMQTAEDNACIGKAYVVGTAHDRERIIATDILFDALMGSNESPLKKELLAADIAGDADAYLVDALLQPIAIIYLRNSKENVSDAFQDILKSTVKRLCRDGIGREQLEASLSRAEFIMRERDFGTAEGVVLAMQSLSGWLYDDSMATTYLRYEEVFEHMRSKLDEGYFEDLLESIVLNNDHYAMAEIIPVQGDNGTSKSPELDLMSTSLTLEQERTILEEVAMLRRLQEEPDSPESLVSLPLLQLSDLAEAPSEPAYELLEDKPLPCLYHDIPTRHINYVYHYFDLNHLAFEDLPYISILTMLLGKLDTTRYSAAQLDNLIQSRLGSLRYFPEIHESEFDPAYLNLKLVAGASALTHNLEDLSSLPSHIWSSTLLDNTAKIKDILQQRRIGMEQGFITSGQDMALLRCASYYNKAALIRDEMSGINFYYFLKDLLANFSERCNELCARLDNLTQDIFVLPQTVSSFTGTTEECSQFWESANTLELKASPSTLLESKLIVPEPVIRNEAFIVPADICFASTGYDRRLLDIPYGGSWQVASRALSYDFLWNEVRVKGGAYGAGFRANRAGTMQFYSYRDPRLDATLERFKQAGSWLASFNPPEKEMRGYIISTTAGHDTPQKPRELMRRQDTEYFSDYTIDYREKARKEIIATTPQLLNQLGDTVTSVAQKECRCIFGNNDILRSTRTDSEIIELISS